MDGDLYFLVARLSVIPHLWKGHRVRWRTHADDLCPGDIICDTCNLGIWCRWHDPKWLGGQTDPD